MGKLPSLQRNNSQGNVKQILKGFDFTNPSRTKNSQRVRNITSRVKSTIQFVPSIGQMKNLRDFQKEINQDRKTLEEQRLAQDSQNTRLIKIQQKERCINEQYIQQKKKMGETLEILVQQAEEFNEEQRKMNEELERKKTSVVIKQDDRREKEQDLKKKDEIENQKKEQTLQEYRHEIKILEEEHKELRKKKKQLMIYHDFLNDVIKLQKEERDSNQQQDEVEKNVNGIIERFNYLQKEAEKFINEQKEMEQEQNEIKRQIQNLKSDIQSQHFQHISDLYVLKRDIDEINQDNSELLVNVEGKFSDLRGKHLDYGQIYFGINNLYQEYILLPSTLKKTNNQYGADKKQEQIEEESSNKDTTQLLLEKLNAIQRYLTTLKAVKDKFKQDCPNYQPLYKD
ncbi:hypothetical protein PPERSA_12680 [Pseudocohnilembus persalinus]|uniref:DUF4200 domain-containing protein n=1 Tax=Pseudocohnilembus persalinus TaxID=266149 RepID=A0A0V0QMR8_PSEPJ|nr:hypothetical protein PPERSA_12680 [Pseudocohnilembus persalinus]|eukprot:KRX03550.1 hypothetical protein PPERSA_12680 [Pseudocohnilembus persalinus]